ncbi:MAG: hypothetical protein KBB83_02985 [Alphaproteobacteria bacterium]|nr:hypothetical protein [Alphaproteobacteria bacterium]
MESYQSLIPYLPYMIFGFLLMAGAALLKILMSYTTVVYRAREAKRALAGPLSMFNREDGESDDEEQEPGRIARFWHSLLVFLRIRKEDQEVIIDFDQAKHTLERHLGRSDYQYKLPWYLLIGAFGSGKSQLMEGVDLDLPLGHPGNDEGDSRKAIKWWYFDRGIVLDVLGDFLIDKSTVSNNERGWSQLMNLLRSSRPKRPIDGIVLTIPADEIYGQGRLSHDEIMERAKHIHTKLWAMQKNLGMRLPVYVVITKTDLVAGFKEFSMQLPPESLGDILGWSSPYSMTNSFDPAWVHESFDRVRTSLQQLRCEIYQADIANENQDGTLVFSVELDKARESLSTYLSCIFKESAFLESLVLRGIYFTGDISDHTAVGNLKRSDRFWTPPEALGAPVDMPFEQHDGYKVGFATDLFARKIFPESALAKPVARILRSTSTWLNYSKVAVASLAIVWTFGLYYSSSSLSYGREQLLSFVLEVDQTLHNMYRRDFDLSKPQDAQYLQNQTVKLLKSMGDINVTSSFNIFIPASWFSAYDAELRRSSTIAWDRIILESMRSGLQEKARNLFLPILEKEEMTYALNPTKTDSFALLSKYVEDTDSFERNVQLYNTLESTQNIEDVGKIVRYLYGVDLPATFYENSDYYQYALGTTRGGDIAVLDYTNAAQKKLHILHDRFLENIFNPMKSTVDVTALHLAMEGLINLASDREMDQNKLYQNINTILKNAKNITDVELKWLQGDEFNPSPVYNDLLNGVSNSRILGVKIANEVSAKTQERFLKYKEAVKALRVPLIDNIFASNGGKVQALPSKSYQEMVDNLGHLLQQPFMASLPVVQNIQPIPPGRSLFWDEAMLSRADRLTDSYNLYVTERLPILSEDLRNVLRSIGRFNLAKHVFHLIARSQTFRGSPNSVTGYDEQELLQQQIQNLKTAQVYLDKVLGPTLTGTLSLQESRLRDLLGDYAFGLLSRIDHILIREDLYGLGDDKLSWWQGVDMVGLRAFGVYDLDGMRSYLAAQKERISFLSKELASPVLTFLNFNFLKSLNRNLQVKNKWIKILLQVDASDKQIPGNSVSVLEHFLQYDLNQIGYDSCYELIDASDISGQTGDFFLDRRNQVRAAMVGRCTHLLQAKGVESYNKMAQFFNLYLSGKYPFTHGEGDDAETEAMAADVEAFLSLYDAIGEVERQTIDSYFESTGSKQSPAEFLRQIEIIRPLLQAALDGNMSMHLPKLDVEISFRTDRNREMGGEKIIDWSLAIGGKVLDFWDDKRAGEWRPGEAVSVDLQWAANGDVYPLKDPTNPSLQVTGNLARFKYTGRWSLIRLVKGHATDVVKFSQKTPISLEFKIPTGFIDNRKDVIRDESVDGLAKVYLQLSLSVPSKPVLKDDKSAPKEEVVPAKPLTVPLFPATAPVMTKGQVVR